jgi:hypothetical protein
VADFGDKPYGLEELVLVPLPTGTAVTLPIGRMLKFKERVKSGELEGDDKVAATVARVTAVEWELEAGGVSLEAWALMTGRTVVSSGSTPNRTVTLEGDAPKSYPYFKIYGKAVGEGSDNIHCKVFKAKVMDGIEGSFQNGEFFITSCKGIGIADSTGKAYEFVQNETAADLPAS